MLPAVIAATGLSLALWVRISPAGFALRSAAQTVAIIAIATELFLLGVQVLVLRAAVDRAPLSGGLLMLGLGALLAVLGNRLGKVRRNFFVGIRTPWTLADEEVWLRTHRVGGKVFVAAGLAIMLLGLVTENTLSMVAVLLIAALVPVAYSFAVYRRIHPHARA